MASSRLRLIGAIIGFLVSLAFNKCDCAESLQLIDARNNFDTQLQEVGGIIVFFLFTTYRLVYQSMAGKRRLATEFDRKADEMRNARNNTAWMIPAAVGGGSFVAQLIDSFDPLTFFACASLFSLL